MKFLEELKMKIINVTTKEQLKELYDNWAMTWEGLSEDSFEEALECCSKSGTDGTGYLMKGSVMNELSRLTGSNAYPDDLNIFSIIDFKGLAIQFGARWMTDIIDNNLRREGLESSDIF
jgi:hypothetical protein